ncbi:MAG: hypothetical protein JWM32_3120 [Verrucomicrobia bacterium]|nr:hypothetical protein [Verrucomicrobiota bacterium]
MKKPLSDYSDPDLIHRYQGLGRLLFFEEGRLRIPQDASATFRLVHAELIRRKLSDSLLVERYIQATDCAPTFHKGPLVRYGKTGHLQDFIDGLIYMSSAQCFRQLENEAQCDNELRREWSLANADLTIGEHTFAASSIRQGRDYGKTGTEGYHLLCFSYEESPKLQRMFGADCYVVVADWRVFFETIRAEIRTQLNADPVLRDVRYYDDDSIPQMVTVDDLVFQKSLWFWHQREVRLAVYDVAPLDQPLQFKVTWPPGLVSAIRTFI